MMVLEDVLLEPESIPYVRRWLFERLAAGLLPPERAVALAWRIGVELEAGGYAMALFDLPAAALEPGAFSQPASGAREALLAYFLKYSEYMPVELAPNMGAVLVKGDAGAVPELTDRCVRRVGEEYDRAGVAGWHLAASGPVTGLGELPACYEQVSRLWALRVVMPGRQVLRPGAELALEMPGEPEQLPDVDPAWVDPESIRDFLQNGRREDVPAFVRRYLTELAPAMSSRPLRDHVLLTARFAAERYVISLGVPRERYLERLGPWGELSGEPERFLERALGAALELREQRTCTRAGTLDAALEYVDRRFTEPDLTLSRTAEQVGVTASYLSALFRKELDRTFTRYVTDRRMELARRLLLSTDRRAGQIARAVGFRDGHYFSALFKRTQGCTPAQFRRGGERP